MASTFVVADILSDVATLCNIPAFTTTTHVTTAKATYWLVQSARSLSALLRQKLGDDRDFLQTTTLSVTGNSGSLPSNCGEVHAVIWAKNAIEYYLMGSAQQDDLVDADTAEEPWLTAPRYRIDRGTITFYPGTTTAQNVLVYYTNHLDLTAQTSFEGRLDFDRWITLDLCERVCTAKDRDPSQFVAQRQMLEQNLFAASRGRDANETHTIRDVRSARARDRIRGWRF